MAFSFKRIYWGFLWRYLTFSLGVEAFRWSFVHTFTVSRLDQHPYLGSLIDIIPVIEVFGGQTLALYLIIQKGLIRKGLEDESSSSNLSINSP